MIYTTTPADNVRVVLDGATDAFPAHDDGRRVNGAALPTFTRETADALVAWTQATLTCAEDEHLYWEGDILVAAHPQDDGQPLEVVARVEADEHGRYAIGDGWGWNVLPA